MSQEWAWPSILPILVASLSKEGEVRLHIIRRFLKRAERLTFRQIKRLIICKGWGLLEHDEVEYLFARFDLYNL